MMKITRIESGDAHLDQKFLVLQAEIEGTPVVKRRSINTQALVDGTLSIESEKAKLIADVEEYHARWLAVQAAINTL